MINKVILVGNLGKDPESFGDANPVVKFSIATSERWTDKQGQRQEKTEWHNIVAFGRTGEICKEYLSKGRQVYIEGKIQTRQWDDKDGNKRYTTEIIANHVMMLGKRDEQEIADVPKNTGYNQSRANPSGGSRNPAARVYTGEGPRAEDMTNPFGDNDVPF